MEVAGLAIWGVGTFAAQKRLSADKAHQDNPAASNLPARVTWSATESAIFAASTVGAVAAATALGNLTDAQWFNDAIKLAAGATVALPAMAIAVEEIKDSFHSLKNDAKSLIERVVTGPAARLARKVGVGALSAAVLSSAISVTNLERVPLQDRLDTVVDAVLQGPMNHSLRQDVALLAQNSQRDGYLETQAEQAIRHISKHGLRFFGRENPALAVAAATLVLDNVDQFKITLPKAEKHDLIATIIDNFPSAIQAGLSKADTKMLEAVTINPVAAVIRDTEARDEARFALASNVVYAADKLTETALKTGSFSQLAAAGVMLATVSTGVQPYSAQADLVSNALISHGNAVQSASFVQGNDVIAAGLSFKYASNITTSDQSNLIANEKYISWATSPQTKNMLNITDAQQTNELIDGIVKPAAGMGIPIILAHGYNITAPYLGPNHPAFDQGANKIILPAIPSA